MTYCIVIDHELQLNHERAHVRIPKLRGVKCVYNTVNNHDNNIILCSNNVVASYYFSTSA